MALSRVYLPTKRIYSLLFLLLLWLCLGGTVSAAEISTTDLNELQTIFSQLEQNCNQQDQQLLRASELLKQSNLQIESLKLQLVQANQSISQATISLGEVNKSFKEYSAEQKKIQQRLKIERDFAILGIVAALFVRH